MLMEKIGFVESSYLKLASGINYYPEISQGLQNIQYGLRDSVEQRDNYIQPIAIAVVLSKSGDKILCVKKTEKSTKSDSPESGQTLLYVGGHMRKEDESRECHNFLDVLRNTLQREILEELGISLVISKEEIPFVIYTPDNEKSKKHLAIGWKVYIDEASNPVPAPLLGHRCRSSQEITGSPTPFSTSNHYLWICPRASFSLSNPNIAA